MYMICICVQIYIVFMYMVFCLNLYDMYTGFQVTHKWQLKDQQNAMRNCNPGALWRWRCKKLQAVGPVGSRGSKLDKTIPSWNAETPTDLGFVFLLACSSLTFFLRCLFEVKATFQTRFTKDGSNIHDRFQALCLGPRCSSFQLSDYSLLPLVEWLTLWD